LSSSDPPSSDPRSDEQLVHALNGGEADAFEALYYRYRDWVARLAQRFCGNENDALDVVQETFLYFHRKFPGFILSARLTTFLYPVVKHLALAIRRKRGRMGEDLGALETMAAPQSPSAAEGIEDLKAVIAAVPEIHREVLLMRYLDDMGLEEIANALSIPLGTVKSRIHNALRMLSQDERTKRFFE
jgi:RNA polymerase sigma-70 factor, ECF subfamily